VGKTRVDIFIVAARKHRLEAVSGRNFRRLREAGRRDRAVSKGRFDLPRGEDFSGAIC